MRIFKTVKAKITDGTDQNLKVVTLLLKNNQQGKFL